ncbi:hypothetical protein BCR44DRAFT_1011702 [Catenaria anguillulae PL171]|uniref:Uncharacterized protein n=1 Tax=Catenaria anguillulae PL171 TaxID=765915 RepID=A0A1Y2I836_9FUNG|nr:hypothetical protein BCR44DRAFT_1011702 [Catenaria anguillulae PL171]
MALNAMQSTTAQDSADPVDFDQFEMDLADFFVAILGPEYDGFRTDIHDLDEAEAILMDVASDLAKSQECRDFIGKHTVFWSCVARLRNISSPSLQRLLLKVIRNACIHCPESQQSALSSLRADQLTLNLGSSAFASTPRDVALVGLAIEAATNLTSGSSTTPSSPKFGDSIDPADLAKWTLNMLLAHPTKALRLVMVWLANGILPMYPSTRQAWTAISRRTRA